MSLLLIYKNSNCYNIYFVLLGITCVAVDVADSSKVSDKNVYDFNTTVIYRCDAGFERINGDFSRKCVAINKWTGTTPTCGSKYIHVF